MTYIWKVFQRNQVSGVGDGSRYYTTFFHGPYGVFTGGNNYYGCHPYPVPPEIPNPGDGKWELSTNSQDYTGRGTNQANSGGDPFVTNGQWYSQALVLHRAAFDELDELHRAELRCDLQRARNAVYHLGSGT
jgi:hypothetical protein